MGTTKNLTFPYDASKWSTEYRYFAITDATPDWVKSAYAYYYASGNKNSMMNEVIIAKNWAVEHNVPIICNEFGANPGTSDTESFIYYFTAVNEIFSELEIPWHVWFGTFDSDGELIDGIREALGVE